MIINYTREQLGGRGAWDLNHPDRGTKSHQDVRDTISGLVRIEMTGSSLDIEFSRDLDAGEISTLDTIISNHKTNI